MTRKTGFATLAMLLLASASTRNAAAQGPEGGRFKLTLTGAFGVSSLDFSGTRRFTEFAEEGQVSADYTEDSGPGIEGGLSYRFGSHVGVALVGSYLTRDGSAAFHT